MLGDNIKAIRSEKGYSQKYVAEKVGVSEAYISLIESNKRPNLGSELLEKLADALEVDVVEFYKNSQQNNNDKKDKLSEQIEYVESLKLDSPEEALKFILQQPNFMAYGGYDLDDLSEDEIMDLANDMLFAMKLSIEKMKRK